MAPFERRVGGAAWHAITKSHEWVGTGRFFVEWWDGWHTYVERLECSCGAHKLDMTIASIQYGLTQP